MKCGTVLFTEVTFVPISHVLAVNVLLDNCFGGVVVYLAS